MKFFSNTIDDFAKEEASYLPSQPKLQDRLNIESITYLYCVSPEDWARIPDMFHKFHQKTELSMEDKMYFFPNHLPPDAIFLRSTRAPRDLMEVHGEKRLQLLIPRKEQEFLDDFKENFVVEYWRSGYFGSYYNGEEKGFFALKLLSICINKDFSAFGDGVKSNCFVPKLDCHLKISFHDKNLGSFFYTNGSGVCIREITKNFSEYCKVNPDFKEQLITLCKYNLDDSVFRMDRLTEGLDSYEVQNLKELLPNYQTSLVSLSERKPDVPDKNTRSYEVRNYLEYISNVAILKAPSRDKIPVFIARELAGDNINLRLSKLLLKEYFAEDFFVEKIADAYRTDAATKKILKSHKMEKSPLQSDLNKELPVFDGLRTALQRYSDNGMHGKCGDWCVSTFTNEINNKIWTLYHKQMPVAECFNFAEVPTLQRIGNISDKSFLAIYDLVKSVYRNCQLSPTEQERLTNSKDVGR